MPTTYKGLTVPLSSDLADGPATFRDFTDSLPAADALVAQSVPPGTISFTCRTTAPTGWLMLDGATVVGAQTLYPALWAVVPASWHVGADLKLPDAKGRVLIGIDPADTTMDAIGDTGGAKTRTLTGANMPSHNHGGNTFMAGAHAHGTNLMRSTASGGLGQVPLGSGLPAGNTDAAPDHAHGIPSDGNASPAAFGILPPFLALGAMIKAA